MAQDEGKQNEEKFDFTREGEALGYISLDQARVLAMRTAREAPGDYGRRFSDTPMAFDVVEAEETEDYYEVTLSYRPQGQFSGTTGQEQFFIEKEGNVAVRQVLSLPGQVGWRRIPLVFVAIGLVVIGAVAVGGVFAATSGGDGSDDSVPQVAALPTSTPESSVTAPVATPTTAPTIAPLAPTAISRNGSTDAIPLGLSTTGSLLLARSEHSAVLLESGKVLVVGSAPIEVYDPATRTFGFADNTRCNHGWGPSATLLSDGKVLIAGGNTSPRCAEIYDSETGQFPKVGDLNADHFRHAATLLSDGKVLIVGGLERRDGGEMTHAVAEVYDPVAETFGLTGSLRVDRRDFTATLLPSGQVLITGGSKYATLWTPTGPWPGVCVGSPELYDPVTGTFSPDVGVITNNCDHRATRLNDGNVLITSEDRLAFLFHTETGTFRRAGTTTGRGGHTATLLPSGQVLIAGGWVSGSVSATFAGTALATTEIYDPETGTFTGTDSMGQARGNHTTTLLSNGQVLVVGGKTSITSPTGEREGVALSSAELWIPSSPASTPTPTPVARGTPTRPPAGLVAWWPGDGDAKDAVGGHHGALRGGATFAPGRWARRLACLGAVPM